MQLATVVFQVSINIGAYQYVGIIAGDFYKLIINVALPVTNDGQIHFFTNERSGIMGVFNPPVRFLFLNGKGLKIPLIFIFLIPRAVVDRCGRQSVDGLTRRITNQYWVAEQPSNFLFGRRSNIWV